MTIKARGHLQHFLHQQGMPAKKPLERPDVRSTEPRLHGDSGPAHPSNMHHISFHRHGDRGDMSHTGSANNSKPAAVLAGVARAPGFGNGNGGSNNGNA
jgi:hypothetical protein